MFRRFATVLVLAMWMGGFTFYAEIVIPTATQVLGGGRHVGFITEQVTNWLNLIGIAALGIFLWNLIAEWPRQPRGRQRVLATAWLTMAAAHLGLFATHPLIDHLLDKEAHKILDYDKFDALHTLYLGFATTQWIAALFYTWFSFRAWQHDDKQVPAANHALSGRESLAAKSLKPSPTR